MRHHSCVRSEHHPHSGFERFAKVVALQLADFTVFAETIFEHAVLLAFGLSIVGVVDVHREPHRLLALGRQLDPFIIDQAGMFDRIDPGPDRGLDPLCTVGVGGHPQPGHVGFVGNGGKFSSGHLLLARLIIVGKDPASGANLDHPRTIFLLPPYLIAQLFGRIANAFGLAALVHARG